MAELTRAENIKRSTLGMREDQGVTNDKFHRLSHGCTSRSLSYNPVRPPYSLDIKLPQLYRSELTESLCNTKNCYKFSPTWDLIHNRSYTWADYYFHFKKRPDEQNNIAYKKWVDKNPDAAQKLDTEWTEFLKQFNT